MLSVTMHLQRVLLPSLACIACVEAVAGFHLEDSTAECRVGDSARSMALLQVGRLPVADSSPLQARAHTVKLDNSNLPALVDAESKDVLAAQGPEGVRAWTVDSIQGKDLDKNRRFPTRVPGISLGEIQKASLNRDPEASRDVLAAQGPDGVRAWTVDGIQGKDAPSPLMRALDKNRSFPPSVPGISLGEIQKPSLTSRKKQARPQKTPRRKPDDDSFGATARPKTSHVLGMVATNKDRSGVREGARHGKRKRKEIPDMEELNEKGYLSVVRQRSNAKMTNFVKRLAADMSLEIVDPGGLNGMVPFYSGQKAKQSFSALQAELLSTARLGRGWLVKKGQKKHRY